MPNQKKKSFFKRLFHKYRLVLLDNHSYNEVWSKNVNRLKIYLLFITYSLFLISSVVAVIIYTPLKNHIPGYPNEEMIQNIKLNAIIADSLEQQLIIKEQYLDNIKTIIAGGDPINYLNDKNKEIITTKKTATPQSPREDSLLRNHIEVEEAFDFSFLENINKKDNISKLHFYPPLKGMVTNPFNPSENHYGIDIVSTQNEVISAPLNGSVIMATWTLETGYVIQIQHDNDLISVCKHNAELLKKQGERVKAGEAIAIMGNSGELTTGPHLHFELWHKGSPINPADYIIF